MLLYKGFLSEQMKNSDLSPAAFGCMRPSGRFCAEPHSLKHVQKKEDFLYGKSPENSKNRNGFQRQFHKLQ